MSNTIDGYLISQAIQESAMLPIDVQAEIIRSFQEEKRQRLVEQRRQQRALGSQKAPWRARFLRAGGQALISAGRGLQRAAGAPLSAELDGRQLGWEK
jgi:hypothetical protein